jgi:hypothetical protein
MNTNSISFDEIIASFNTPSQVKLNNLKQHNLILQKQIVSNNRTISKLAILADKEQDIIANKLDKKCKDWRKIIIKNSLKNIK